MGRPKRDPDLLLALEVLVLFRSAKRLNPDLALFEFLKGNTMVPRHRDFAEVAKVLERRYGFPFILTASHNHGRTELAPEADPVLDRFEEAYADFLAAAEPKPRCRPARVGAWGAVLEASLVPAVARSSAGPEPAGVIPLDCGSFDEAMRGLIDFTVDAVLALNDPDEHRTAFHNIVGFHPAGEADIRLVAVSQGEGGGEPRIFPAGLPSHWERCAPRPQPGRGDLTAASPFAALEWVRAGFGPAVVMSLPTVRLRARELGLVEVPLPHVPAASLGVFTRLPRDAMAPDGVRLQVERLLRSLPGG